jgi:hypothetical protein
LDVGKAGQTVALQLHYVARVKVLDLVQPSPALMVKVAFPDPPTRLSLPVPAVMLSLSALAEMMVAERIANGICVGRAS